MMEPWDKVVLPRAEVREGRVAQGNPAVGLWDANKKSAATMYISDKAVWRAP